MKRTAVAIIALLLASPASARNKKKAVEHLSFRPDLPFITVQAVSYRTEAQEVVVAPPRKTIVTRGAATVSGLGSQITGHSKSVEKEYPASIATSRKFITLVQTPERELDLFCGYKDYLGFEPHRGQIAEGYLLVETLYKGEKVILKCDILENRPRK